MNKCKFNEESLVDNFENYLELLTSDSLKLFDQDNNPITITDKIRKQYLSKVISYLANNISFTNNRDISKFIRNIDETQQDWLEDNVQLTTEEIQSALSNSSIKTKDQLNKDYTTAKIEKDNDREEYKNTFTNKYLVTYFGKCIAAQNYCKRQSIQAVIDSCFLNTSIDSSGKVVTSIVKNDEELNLYIRKKQEELYTKVIEYLKQRFSKTPEKLKSLPSSLYSDDFSTYLNSVEKLNSLFGDVLNPDTFNSDYLNNLFVNYNEAVGQNKVNLQTIIDGYTSWVMLNNFTSVLRNTLGDSIYIDDNLSTFSPIDKSGRFDRIKYSLSKAKASNMNQTWRTSEDIDISKEINNIVQLLVTNIKYKGSDRNIKFNEFGYIIGKIKDLTYKARNNTPLTSFTFKNSDDILVNITKSGLFTEKELNIIGNKSFTEILDSMKNDTQEYIPLIFKILSIQSLRNQIKNDFTSNIFNSFDINLIESLYSGLFDSNNTYSLLYANDVNGYDSQNYLSYITQVADSITNVKYLQYFRDIDGNVYVRNMYDQTLDQIQRTIESGILSLNDRELVDFDAIADNLKLKEARDKNNNSKLTKIQFIIPNTKYKVVIDTFGKFGIYDENNTKVLLQNISDNDKLEIKHLADSVLHLGFTTNKELWDTFVFNTGTENGALSDILKLTSNALLYQDISNRILVENNEGNVTPMKNISAVNAILDVIFNEDKYKPKFNKRQGEIYLTSRADYPILYTISLSKALVDGKLTSSQLKDGNGNSLPNTTLSRLLGRIKQQWQTQCKTPNSVTKNFKLFGTGVLQGVYQAKEYKDNLKSTSTAHTEFNPAEVEQAEIIYDFLQGLQYSDSSNSPIGNGIVAFLPSDNSDKSNIGRILIDLKNMRFTGDVDKVNYDNVSLYDLIWDSKKSIIKPNASEILNTVLSQEFGSTDGYYTSIQKNLNTLWNRVIDVVNTYYPNSPYAITQKTNYESAFEAYNNIYIKNPGLEPPITVIENAIRLWNNGHPNDTIILTEHSTYEIDKKSKLLMPNITLEFLSGVFANSNNVQKYFQQQEKQIIYELLNDNFQAPGVSIGTIQLGIDNINISSITDLYKTLPLINRNYGTTLKVTSSLQEILNTLNLKNIQFNLNPTISIYNKLNYLCTQEWMASSVGGHFNHPSKAKIDTSYFRTTPLSETEKEYYQKKENGGNIKVLWLQNTIKLAQLYRKYSYNDDVFRTQVINKEHKVTTKGNKSKQLFGIDAVENFLQERHRAEILDEADRFNAQNKRNVSFTAAMHAFQLNTLQGIPSTANITIITDNNARIHTATGVDKYVPTSDGATYINPFMAYWENGSLGASKVGINKKQFIHFYNEYTGTGGIIKTAGFAVTNEIMCNSIFQRRMMQLMTDHVWRNEDGIEVDADITKDYNNNTIKLVNTSDVKGNFYIKQNGEYYLFVGINYKGNNQYTRTLQKVDSSLLPVEEPAEYNLEGNIINDNIPPTIINSNYLLWQMLGGYECYEQKSGMNRLTHSEYSIKAVSDIANKVGIRKTQGTVRTQSDLYQFMKQSDIHYMPTVGAVKQGAANVEDINNYLKGNKAIGDFKTNFMKIRMDQSGIQLDKEHNADQEDLSIFTQVLSACAARGYTQEQAQNLYNSLAALAYNAVEEYQSAFNDYLDNPTLYKDNFQTVISDLIARALMNETNSSDVLNYIVSNLIELSRKGEQFKFKNSIPFSDASVYNKLISTISTTLTKCAIKIKLSGVLAVLCPSYDIIKLYNNRFLSSYSSQELQELQEQFNNTPNWTIEQGLNSPFELTKTYTIYPVNMSPETVENIIANGGVMRQDGNIDFLLEVPKQRDYLNTIVRSNEITKVTENVLKGRNLAPYDVFFTDISGNKYSLYDCDFVKQRFNKENPSTEAQLQEVLDALSPSSNLNSVLINGNLVRIDKSSIKVKPYEVVLPKVFATNFGLDVDSDLQAISQDKNYFTKKLANNISNTIDDQYYSIALTRLNGDPIYVLDRAEARSSEDFIKIDAPTIIDNKGKVSVINANYDKEFTLSKNQKDLDNNPELKQDEIWQYTDKSGITHKVIVTDDVKYYIDKSSYNGIKITEFHDTDNIEKALKSTTNKIAKQWYNNITHLNVKNPEFDTKVHDFNLTLQNIQEDSSSKNLLQYNSIIQNLQKQGSEIWESFMKSLDLIAARIPAQSLQSVMAMKVVGFVDSDINTAYVSTLQTYLQGSDYDIDSVSLAMYAFDKTGKFVKWSDYFNLSTKEMLQSSLQLPLPTGRRFTYNDFKSSENAKNIIEFISNGTDLTKPVLLINGQLRLVVDTPERLKAFGKLINYINNNGLDFTGKYPSNVKLFQSFLVPIVNNYNQYLNNLDSEERENAIKNNIVSTIYNIVLDPRNQNEAQSSVDATTAPFKKLASTSPKSVDSLYRVPGAFTTNIHAIYNNQVGKKGVGISAVGMKSYFALTQYFNNVLRSGDTQAINRLKFDVSFLGKNYNTLSNVYAENPNEFADELIALAKNNTDYALQLSSIMSLAVDNAKELALAKLNCDPNTMGMWLYGISIGADFKDIGKIMMSKAGYKISELLHGNIFNDEDGSSMGRLFKYIDTVPKISTITKHKLTYKEDDYLNPDNSEYILETLTNIYKTSTDETVQSDINTLIKWLLNRTIIVTDTVDGFNVYNEFKKLSEGAEEMKALGQLLHINQGLYTNTTDTITLLNRIQNVIGNRVYTKTLYDPDYTNKDNNIFDLHKFLTDPVYQKTQIDKYDDVKCTFNLLDMLVNVPHYKEYLRILDLQHNMNYVISSKYRAIYNIGQTMVDYLRAHRATDISNIYKRTQEFVNNYIVSKWLLETPYNGHKGITINLPTGSKYFTISTSNDTPIVQSKIMRTSSKEFVDVYGDVQKVTSLNGVPVNLGTADGRASFKYWMEQQVIPNLQQGSNGRKSPSGKFIKDPNSPLLHNKFIQSLFPNIFTNTPMKTTITGYSTGINMSPRTDSDMEIFYMIKNEFNKLKAYGDYSKYYSGHHAYDLTDLFFLYNLCTYQNKLGENTLTRIFEDSRDWGIIPSFYQYENEMDRTIDIILDNSFTKDDLVKYIAPIANPYTTTLAYFLNIDSTTGEVQVAHKLSNREIQQRTEASDEEFITPYDTTRVLHSNFYPMTDLPTDSQTITTEDLNPDNQSYIDEKGIEHKVENIEINHAQGSILSIKVNGNRISIPESYSKYFKHIPTKAIFTQGRMEKSYDMQKLADDIITLISKQC